MVLTTSCALAEELDVKTLLLDCDLAAGTIQFLLKLGSTASLVDALAHADALDEDLWRQMVARWDKLDVLHAGELDTRPGLDVPGIGRVLSMARAQYEVTCADLGSHFDPLSVAMLRESRRIFLVTTADISVHGPQVSPPAGVASMAGKGRWPRENDSAWRATVPTLARNANVSKGAGTRGH